MNIKKIMSILLLGGWISSLFAPPITRTVSSLADSGPGTLRQAIIDTNANNPGAGNQNLINFSTAGVINITSADLPSIIQPVLIDGTSAPFWAANVNFAQAGPNTATITIQINGPGASLNPTGILNGLVLDTGSDGSIIQGVSITNFATVQGLDVNGRPIGGSGILINSTNNSILGCFIGASPGGTLGANFAAIYITNNNNTIGDGTAAGRNLIAGHYDRRGSVRNSGNNTTILGNTIGLNVAGTASLMVDAPVGLYNVAITGLTLGGTSPGQGNVISGCSLANIEFANCGNCLIQGNYIGTNVTGSQSVQPNGFGILVYGNPTNGASNGLVIDSNVISGNTYGIKIGMAFFGFFPVFGTTITNNIIGLDATGSTPIPNSFDGIWVFLGQATFIGGNTISGNTWNGIRLAKSQLSIIRSNWIGTNSSGADLGNGADGIHIGGQGIGVQAFGDYIGGATNLTNFILSDGNNIQFNGGNGIKTQGFVDNETIQGNFITNNQGHGILISKGASNMYVGGYKNKGNLRIIGDLSSGTFTSFGPLGTSNLISENGGDGIRVINSTNVEAQANVITSNAGIGINFIDASQNLVGAPDQGSSTTFPPFLPIPQVLGNIVTGNGGPGVVVEQNTGNATDNSILSNQIFANASNGIQFVS